MRDNERLSSDGFVEVDDDFLATYNEEDDSVLNAAGGTDATKNSPFDLEVAKPIAIDLRSLGPNAKPPPIANRFPVLVWHSLTPFYKPGVPPTGVWGLGYSAEPEGGEASTVHPNGVFPASELLEICRVGQELRVGLDLAGTFGAPPADEGNAISDMLPNLRTSLTTKQEVRLRLQLSFSVLKVASGPIGEGGARWNLYRQADRIDVNHSLAHTLMVPNGTSELTFSLSSWVRRSFSFLRFGRARHWDYPKRTYRIPIWH